VTDPRDKHVYQIRSLSIPEGGEHSCQGLIVSVLQATRNPNTGVWYLTALVEREQH